MPSGHHLQKNFTSKTSQSQQLHTQTRKPTMWKRSKKPGWGKCERKKGIPEKKPPGIIFENISSALSDSCTYVIVLNNTLQTTQNFEAPPVAPFF